jgi:outer membrane protein assembly factor BamC
MCPRLSLTVLAACVLVAGCGATKGPDYRSQGGKIPSLEVPPDLTHPVSDDRFTIPDVKGTTYSSYTRDRSGMQTPSSGLLPKIDGMKIERNGDQRWLVVKGTPDKLWATLKDFWAEMGFVVRREVQDAGVMETDWAENRSKLPNDIVSRTVGRVFERLYDTGFRDKFRTRLEVVGDAVEIYIAHRGVEEIYNTSDRTTTSWQPRPTDRDLEAEMLSRLMVRLGAAGASKAGVLAAGANDAPRASFDKSKDSVLRISEPFDRSWRRVGLALDRAGFTVEDRDRSKGVYFVRYIDPEAELKTGDSKGFLERLKFWKKDEPESRPQYRVLVKETAGNCEVSVLGGDGKPDSSGTGRRILGLLNDQLR